jgi:hypothetical protein
LRDHLAAWRGLDVQLTGSVVENPQGLHWNTFKFSANARLIVCSNVIGRPQTGQMTSTGWKELSTIPNF